MRTATALLALLTLAACGAGGSGGASLTPNSIVTQSTSSPTPACAAGVLNVTTKPAAVGGVTTIKLGSVLIVATIDTTCNASATDAFTAVSSDSTIAQPTTFQQNAFVVGMLKVGTATVTFTDSVTHAAATLTFTATP